MIRSRALGICSIVAAAYGCVAPSETVGSSVGRYEMVTPPPISPREPAEIAVAARAAAPAPPAEIGLRCQQCHSLSKRIPMDAWTEANGYGWKKRNGKPMSVLEQLDSIEERVTRSLTDKADERADGRMPKLLKPNEIEVSDMTPAQKQKVLDWVKDYKKWLEPQEDEEVSASPYGSTAAPAPTDGTSDTGDANFDHEWEVSNIETWLEGDPRAELL